MSLKKGFSLLELMTALTAASIISLWAFTCYGQFNRTSFQLKEDYRKSSEKFLRELQCVMPYAICGIEKRPVQNKRPQSYD